MIKRIILVVLFSASISAYVQAGDNPGTTAVPFLKKAIGARAASLGEAYTSVGNDPDAVLFNPASLALQEESALSAMYQTGYVKDIVLGSLIYAHPLSKRGTPAVGLLYSDSGSIDVNLTGQPRTYKKAAQENVYFIGYAYRFLEKLSAGLTVKHITSELVEKYDDATTALDAGIIYETPLKGLHCGVSSLNMGSGLTYIAEEDPLPQIIRGGASYVYSYLTSEENLYEFLFTADGTQSKNEKTKGGIGIEMARNTFALRLGYLLNRDTEGFTAGFGFKWTRFSLDYAFGLVEDLEHNHRISFHMHFAPATTREVFKRKEKYEHRPKTLGAQ